MLELRAPCRRYAGDAPRADPQPEQYATTKSCRWRLSLWDVTTRWASAVSSAEPHTAHRGDAPACRGAFIVGRCGQGGPHSHEVDAQAAKDLPRRPFDIEKAQ